MQSLCGNIVASAEVIMYPINQADIPVHQGISGNCEAEKPAHIGVPLSARGYPDESNDYCTSSR